MYSLTKSFGHVKSLTAQLTIGFNISHVACHFFAQPLYLKIW